VIKKIFWCALWFYGFWHRVFLKIVTSVSEEFAASIFWVEVPPPSKSKQTLLQFLENSVAFFTVNTFRVYLNILFNPSSLGNIAVSLSELVKATSLLKVCSVWTNDHYLYVFILTVLAILHFWHCEWLLSLADVECNVLFMSTALQQVGGRQNSLKNFSLWCACSFQEDIICYGKPYKNVAHCFTSKRKFYGENTDLSTEETVWCISPFVFFASNIIRVVKWRRIRWVGDMACMG